MISRDDLAVEELEPAPWGGQQWRVTVTMPDGLGGTDEMVFKLVSTKGMGGLPTELQTRASGGIHVYGRDEHVWYGVLPTWDPVAAVDQFLLWLEGKRVGLEMLAVAPVSQLVSVVGTWYNSLALTSALDPNKAWQDVVALVCEITLRMESIT